MREKLQGEDRTWFQWLTPFTVVYGLLLVIALAMRLWDLGSMALHHDESLHATYSWYLFSGRGYQHNPMMHGPYQFFANAGFFAALGDSSYTIRVAEALTGTAIVAAPLLFLRHLGRSGALITAFMLTFSPVMLYYSRFSREDMHIALWTLLLIGFMWQYMDTRKVRFLALTSLALVFAFSVKESAYLLAAVLGSYFFLAAITDVAPWVLGRKPLREFSPAGDVLLVLATLVMPLGAAFIALFQGPLGLTLANPDWTSGPIGIPKGAGLYVAFVTVVVVIVTSAVVGLRWRPKVWLLCAGIFWGVWVLLYTSFFTNIIGVGSGLWQALAYWIAQQDVARGGQPWYYYIVIGFNYEFLPLIFGLVAVVVFASKGDRFGRFLAYWAVLNFLALMYASEKMPWLLVHVTVPFILLSGKLLGGLVDKRPWSTVLAPGEMAAQGRQWLARVHWQAVGFTVFLVLFVAVLGGLLLLLLSQTRSMALVVVLALALLVLGMTLAYALRGVAPGKRLALAGVSLAVVMFAMTVPSAFRAAYANADVPLEMLVYTQTAPDIPQIMAAIDRLAEELGKGKDLKIMVDSGDGYSWPWAWYLRDYRYVSHICLTGDSGCSRLTSPPDADVLLLNERSFSSAPPYTGAFGPPVFYKHRWWFPESYRGITPERILDGLQSRESLCKVAAYFLFREMGQPMGSVNAYAYFPPDFDVGPVGVTLSPKRMAC